MGRSKEEIAEILKKAIKGEEEGYFFYNLLAEKAVDTNAKKMLELLRDDEIRHKETLIDIYKKHIGGEIGELPDKGINALAEIFRKGHLEDKKTEIEFINLAIEAELAATKYYQEERNLIDDPIFKEIFDQLAQEEHGHYELLMAEREAILGNHHWFSYDNDSPMEH